VSQAFEMVFGRRPTGSARDARSGCRELRQNDRAKWLARAPGAGVC